MRIRLSPRDVRTIPLRIEFSTRIRGNVMRVRFFLSSWSRERQIPVLASSPLLVVCPSIFPTVVSFLLVPLENRLDVFPPQLLRCGLRDSASVPSFPLAFSEGVCLRDHGILRCPYPSCAYAGNGNPSLPMGFVSLRHRSPGFLFLRNGPRRISRTPSLRHFQVEFSFLSGDLSALLSILCFFAGL